MWQISRFSRYNTGKQSCTKSYFSSKTKPVTVHDFLLLLGLKLVLLSGGNGCDLDYSRTVTIITRLFSEVGTGAAMVPPALLIRGSCVNITSGLGG